MNHQIQSHSTKQSLDEWLFYLENLHATEIDLGLSRISQVAKRLNINFNFANVITVAGTNGKGTTCAFLENALLAEHYSVAVYSSPHIERFNERLRINSINVADQPLIDAFERIEQARKEISLTYYEYTTLAAFLVLMQQRPDMIILEVGLGGRLDATNIIDADISVITTVDLDHQAFLGNTREKIGFEKAGIMRSGKRAIIGDLNPPESVLTHGENISALLTLREQDFFVSTSDNAQEVTQEPTWTWQNVRYQLTALKPTHIPQQNVATAIAILDALNISLTSEKINNIITKTKVAGRTEMFTKHCDIMLDVGHNPQATRYLANVIKTAKEQGKYDNIHAVVGMLADKDIKSSLAPLSELIDTWNFVTLSVPRGAKAEMLTCHITPKNISEMNCFDNVLDGYKMALSIANERDLVLVFGSFFTVADVRNLLIEE